MVPLRLLWVAVPLLGLGELGAHLYFSKRAPSLDEWLSLRPEIEKLRRHDELVVIAPAWAEPLARHAFGDERMPIAHVARPDASGFARAIEISTIGAESREVSDWRVVERLERGRFVLRVLQNPHFTPTRFDFVEAVATGKAEVRVEKPGGGEPCLFTDAARVSTGGLLGNVAYPRARFRCGADDAFVGVTVIEDEEYRPHRCVLARLPKSGTVSIVFRDVPIGSQVRGYSGLSYFLHRDERGPAATLAVRVGQGELGRHLHREETSWQPFEFATTPNGSAEVEFEIAGKGSRRELCFFADSR